MQPHPVQLTRCGRQLKFSNNELGNRIQVTEELKQVARTAATLSLSCLDGVQLLDGQLGVLSIEEAALDNEMAELQKTVGEHEVVAVAVPS